MRRSKLKFKATVICPKCGKTLVTESAYGYGSQMIKESIETRWKMDGEKNTVYLHAMGVTGDLSYDEKLKSFYEKIGFSELCSDREIMVLTAD